MDKSKLLEGLKKIKEAFQSQQKFVDAKLNDGTTIIRYDGDKLDIGVAVMAVTDQGAIALPDGDYTLEDGTAFTIANGVVAEVSNAAEEAGDATEKTPPASGTKPAAASAAPHAANVKSIVESVIREQRFGEQFEEITNALSELTKQKENFATQKTDSDKKISDLENDLANSKKTIKEMFELLEKIAGEPGATPAQPVPNKFDIKEFRKNYKKDLENITNNI